MASFETKMQRSKTGIRTAVHQNPNRGSNPLPVTVFEMPEENLADERVFEETIRGYQKQHQQDLEKDLKCRKPTAFVEQTTKFSGIVNFEFFGEWSKGQHDLEQIEEVA